MNNILLNVLRKNLLYMFSLVLSVALWFYVLSTEPLSIEREVKVNYIIPTGKAILSPVKSKMKISLEGPRAFMRSLEKNDLMMTINLLKNITPKNNRYYIDKNRYELPLPLGVTIKRAEEESLSIELGRKSKKAVKVDLSLFGEVLENHKLIYARAVPSEVEVEGVGEILKKN